MVGPVGNTELGGRWRHVHHLQVAYEEAIASSSHFRENLRPYRPARSRRKIAYGVLRSGIRLLTSVVEPANLAQKRKEGRFPASLIYTPCALPLTLCMIRGEFLYTLCTLNTSSGWCRATSFASSRVEQTALASPPFFKLRI